MMIMEVASQVVLDMVDDGVLLVRNKIVCFVNGAGEKLLNTKKADILGNKIYLLLFPLLGYLYEISSTV